MKVDIREDSVVISGYINAVERLSRPIKDRKRTFLERIKAGAFRNALKRNENVPIYLNHNPDRVLARTGEGTAILEEDNIGLRGEITITDAEVMQKARDGKLSGWSFGFFCNDEADTNEDGNDIRTVTDMDLVEVSILDDTRTPAYYGTSIYARGGEDVKLEIRAEEMTEGANAEEAKTVEVSLDELANKIAEIVIAKMQEQQKRETEAQEKTDEENKTMTETQSANAESDAADEKDAEAESEERSIDYSEFERRLTEANK